MKKENHVLEEVLDGNFWRSAGLLGFAFVLTILITKIYELVGNKIGAATSFVFIVGGCLTLIHILNQLWFSYAVVKKVTASNLNAREREEAAESIGAFHVLLSLFVMIVGFLSTTGMIFIEEYKNTVVVYKWGALPALAVLLFLVQFYCIKFKFGWPSAVWKL